MRIIYFCNKPRNPTGGTNVIYRHVNRLNNMGISAAVMHARHTPFRKQPHTACLTICDSDLQANDHVIIPEISAAEMASKLIPYQMSYSIFVQNGYYLPCRARSYTEQDVDHAYQQSSHILSISEHTSAMIKLHYPETADRIVRMTSGIDHTYFYLQEEKEKIITYMPRKNAAHIEAAVFALGKHIPSDWRLVPIDKLSQTETAALLRKSRIFLSFSNLEGLGLPPIEAAICGNVVIGYHGGGGLDYWCAPNFEEVAVGDMHDFVKKVNRQIAMQTDNPLLDKLKPVIATLQETYSQAHEDDQLRQLAELAETAVAGKPHEKRPVKLQTRSSLLHALLGRRNFRRRTPVQRV